MGDVFRARDTRLKRDVALKALPEGVADNPDRRQRFEREAQATAQLEHANVASVFDVGVVDGTPFIVSELVDGATLRSRLAGGALPPAAVVALGAQVAEALGAAHGRAIVHRDIKPENILVTADDQVKVVDFGIAKTPTAPDENTVTAFATGPGTVVGTASYMSPEQIQGADLDHRSDIFSLGCVLFEMATGQRPFSGNTSAESMASVLRDEPRSVEELAAVPAGLAAIIMRCLEKRASRRFQSAPDLAFALRHSLAATTLTAAPVSSPGSGRWRLPAVATVAVVAVTIAGFAWWPPSMATVPVNFTVRQLTFDSGVEAFPNLSRDGSLLVYTGTITDNRDIFLRDINAREAINLTVDSPANDSEPALSPDGQQIAFRSDREGGGIFVVNRTGGIARRITRSGFNPTWSPDGSRIATATEAVDWRPDNRSANQAQLQIHDVVSGMARALTTGDAVQPAWSPGGYRIAYWGLWERNQRDIWTVAVDGGEPVRVTDDDAIDWDPHWSADGRWLYFSSDRGGTMNLWRVAIDERSGVPAGQPEPLMLPSTWTGHARVGLDGAIVYSSFQRVSNIDRVPLDPESGTFTGPPTPLTTGSNFFSNPQPSRDGRWLAFAGQNGIGRNVFVSTADGQNIHPVTAGPFRETGINWGPDGRVGFYSSRAGLYQLFVVNTDGSELRQLTSLGGFGVAGVVWSHDGRYLASYEPVTARAFLVDLSGTLPVKDVVDLPKLADGRTFIPSAWSFDNARILGQAAGGGVAVLALADRAYRVLTKSGAGGPRWLPDGRRILYSENDQFFLVDERSGQVTSIGRADSTNDIPQARQTMNWSLAWDGRWIYRTRFTIQSDLWLMSSSDRR